MRPIFQPAGNCDHLNDAFQEGLIAVLDQVEAVGLGPGVAHGNPVHQGRVEPHQPVGCAHSLIGGMGSTGSTKVRTLIQPPSISINFFFSARMDSSISSFTKIILYCPTSSLEVVTKVSFLLSVT
jgi:hypothetical protein